LRKLSEIALVRQKHKLAEKVLARFFASLLARCRWTLAQDAIASCYGDHSQCRDMLRRKPTRIELKPSDEKELEKKVKPAEPESDAKRAVHERIGLK
jgi:hypothetical protein